MVKNGGELQAQRSQVHLKVREFQCLYLRLHLNGIYRALKHVCDFLPGQPAGVSRSSPAPSLVVFYLVCFCDQVLLFTEACLTLMILLPQPGITGVHHHTQLTRFVFQIRIPVRAFRCFPQSVFCGSSSPTHLTELHCSRNISTFFFVGTCFVLR